MGLSRTHKLIVAAVVAMIATATALTFTRADPGPTTPAAALPRVSAAAPTVSDAAPSATPTRPTATPDDEPEPSKTTERAAKRSPSTTGSAPTTSPQPDAEPQPAADPEPDAEPAPSPAPAAPTPTKPPLKTILDRLLNR